MFTSLQHCSWVGREIWCSPVWRNTSHQHRSLFPLGNPKRHRGTPDFQSLSPFAALSTQIQAGTVKNTLIIFLSPPCPFGASLLIELVDAPWLIINLRQLLSAAGKSPLLGGL